MLLKGFPIIGLSTKLTTCSRFRISRLPLSMNLFRDEASLQKVRDSLKRRFRDPTLADKISSLDKKVRECRFQLQQTRKTLNAYSKEMSRAGVVDDSAKQQQQVKKLEAMRLEEEVNKLQTELAKAVGTVGNLVHHEAPVSQSEEHNKVVLTEGIHRKNEGLLPYWKVFEKLDAVDLKRGQKLSGHRGYFLKGIGVRLAQSLTNMALDFLEKKGFTLYQTPAMIRSELMQECCQLNTLEEDMYKITGEDMVLIATSEQPLACMYRQEILTELPIRLGGYSTCFRKEAGAHGKDNQGIFRVHQFEKAEQFIICAEEESEKYLEQMVKNSMQFYQQLHLPFQVVQIVTGQLNDAANRKFDLQAWFPHSGKYRQLVSVSNCTDYQSRMLDIKYRSKQSTKHVHMLNGTLCAIQRALCCIVQTHSTEKGVKLPAPLAKYYGKELIEFVK